MLFFNLKRVFALRGVSNPYSQLVKIGISRPTAWNLLENNVASINSKHLEKICEYLRCEPNDLYEWKPDRDTVNAGDHPLKRLRRDDKAAAFREMIRNIPLDKINEAEAMLAELRNQD